MKRNRFLGSVMPMLALTLILEGGTGDPGTTPGTPGTPPPFPDIPPIEDEIPETGEEDGISPLTDIDEPIHLDK